MKKENKKNEIKHDYNKPIQVKRNFKYLDDLFFYSFLTINFLFLFYKIFKSQA